MLPDKAAVALSELPHDFPLIESTVFSALQGRLVTCLAISLPVRVLQAGRPSAAHAMYDFCLTLPYAALLALGGLIGFLTKGSLPSLLGGLGSAAVLAACGQASLARYHQARNETLSASGRWGVPGLLGWFELDRRAGRRAGRRKPNGRAQDVSECRIALRPGKFAIRSGRRMVGEYAGRMRPSQPPTGRATSLCLRERHSWQSAARHGRSVPIVLTDRLGHAGRAVPAGDSRVAGGGGRAGGRHVPTLAGDRQVHAGGHRGGDERRNGCLLHLEHDVYRAAAAAGRAQPVSFDGGGACLSFACAVDYHQGLRLASPSQRALVRR